MRHAVAVHTVPPINPKWGGRVASKGVSPGYVATSLSLNALTGDGTPNGKTDPNTASGMAPADLAEQIVIAIANGDADLVVAGMGVSIYAEPHILTRGMYMSGGRGNTWSGDGSGDGGCGGGGGGGISVWVGSRVDATQGHSLT